MRGPGRPLSELLQEQQEPFVLDVYLAERGHYCSERLLLLASNKSSSCTFCCHGNASKKLQFFTSHGFIKCWKNAFTSCHKTPNNHHHHHHHHSNYSVDHYDAEVVLSLPRKFLSIFNEILEAAYTPAFHQLIGSKRRAVTEKNIHEKILLVERQQRHLTCNKRHLVISSEFSCLSNLEWSGLQSDLVGEVGVEIGAALLEDIKEETILDMIAQEVYCLSHVKVVAAGTASRVEGPQQLPKKLFIF
ncbi:uncharacterized protein LOC121968068 isoform X1 [Zingiber officinale]|uniref:uncharacterized protein LOC121968068 isoform X1 n=1 Tax=Zingiber officinale TaxID=94328 RepID=UPI001C4D9BA8|nr:uncharacterized protein LOC121968068 isoform X1 [Zingiber officinale]